MGFKKSSLGWELLKLKVPLQGMEQKEGSPFTPFSRLQGSAESVRGYIQLLGWDKGRARSTISSGCRRNKENAWYSRANSQLGFRIAVSGFQR